MHAVRKVCGLHVHSCSLKKKKISKSVNKWNRAPSAYAPTPILKPIEAGQSWADTLAGLAAGLPRPVTVPVKLLRFVLNWNIEWVPHIWVIQLSHGQHLQWVERLGRSLLACSAKRRSQWPPAQCLPEGEVLPRYGPYSSVFPPHCRIRCTQLRHSPRGPPFWTWRQQSLHLAGIHLYCLIKL